MSGFESLKKDVVKKDKKFNMNSNLKSEIIKLDTDESTTIKNKSISYKLIEKEKYCFRVFIVLKKIPEKDEKSNHYLDYIMKDYYFLNIVINNDYDIIEVSIDCFKDLKTAKMNFDELISLIDTEDCEYIFNYLKKKINKK